MTRPRLLDRAQGRRSDADATDASMRRGAAGVACGFTLIEILVALAVIAVALSAGMRALAQSTNSATLLKQRTLALWVAQNQLATAQLAPTGPALGATEGAAVQAGSRFLWRETVSGTANAAFRKIEVTVADPDQPDYALAQLVGYVGLPPAR